MQVSHAKNIIEVENVSFRYGDAEILEHITLNVHEGDYLGVVGGNGAGKTTLMKVILGLLKPTQGTLRLFGTDIGRFKHWSDIGYVPQQATNFDRNFPATVFDVVLMARTAKRGLFGRLKKGDRQAAEKALGQVNMQEYRSRLIGDLSGGQQQRVFIARALAQEPKVIILDEPTTGIDQKSRDDFYALLRRLNQEMNLTLVLVTHDVERILQEAMHIACIDKRLVCHSSPEEFLRDNPQLVIGGQTIHITEHHHQ